MEKDFRVTTVCKIPREKYEIQAERNGEVIWGSDLTISRAVQFINEVTYGPWEINMSSWRGSLEEFQPRLACIKEAVQLLEDLVTK